MAPMRLWASPVEEGMRRNDVAAFHGQPVTYLGGGAGCVGAG